MGHFQTSRRVRECPSARASRCGRCRKPSINAVRPRQPPIIFRSAFVSRPSINGATTPIGSGSAPPTRPSALARPQDPEDGALLLPPRKPKAARRTGGRYPRPRLRQASRRARGTRGRASESDQAGEVKAAASAVPTLERIGIIRAVNCVSPAVNPLKFHGVGKSCRIATNPRRIFRAKCRSPAF
jgi:hypothetical protein